MSHKAFRSFAFVSQDCLDSMADLTAWDSCQAKGFLCLKDLLGLKDFTRMLNIPGYEILQVLGQGGMATVYLARHLRLERLVAIKVMSRFFASDSGFYERFDKEARTVAKLNHPNIITVYDVGVIDNLPYITMEYLPNGDVKSKIKAGMAPAEAVSYLNTIAEALQFAHLNKCVHRDIKPENILFRQDGSPAIADFGVVKTLSDDSSMTVVGAVIGTPKYMSPEQAQGLCVSEKSDFYSLGVMFHEMLTGHAPYSGDSSVSVLVNHVNSPLPKLSHELKAFQPLINGMMCKNARDRLSDVTKIRQISQRSLAEYQRRSRRKVIMQPRKPYTKYNPALDDVEGKTEIWTTPVHPHLGLQTTKAANIQRKKRSWSMTAKCAAFAPLLLGTFIALPGYTLPLPGQDNTSIFTNSILNEFFTNRLTSMVKAEAPKAPIPKVTQMTGSPDSTTRQTGIAHQDLLTTESSYKLPSAQHAADIIQSSLSENNDQYDYKKCSRI